jgi:hypothetical protein
MSILMKLVCWEVLALLFGLYALISARLFSGQINTNGLLIGTKGDRSRYLSPERVELLLFQTKRRGRELSS